MKPVSTPKATSRTLHAWPGVLIGGVALAVACQANSGGLERDADTDGNPTITSGASGGSGGSQTGGAGEAGADTSGDSETTVTSSTDGGSSTTSDSGGSAGNGGASNATGDDGAGGTSTSSVTTGAGGTSGDVDAIDDCTFHTEPAEPGEGGEGGAGAVDAQTTDHNFIGTYLVDGAGNSLYIYGADYPGDCENAPVTNCFDDCLLAWPVFDAGARRLGEGLDDAAFGTFLRSDGVQQTTYKGWPLYTYKKDLVPGDLVGHGRGTWFAAETDLPNVTVMRASEADGGIKYLATENGRTLYVYAGDVLGTADTLPKSACIGACLNDYRPFAVNSLRLAVPIDPSDITLFVREDSGGIQIAYKGAPLYTSDLDERSGQLHGAAAAEWSVSAL